MKLQKRWKADKFLDSQDDDLLFFLKSIFFFFFFKAYGIGVIRKVNKIYDHY